MSRLRVLWEWTLQERWRTWVSHGLICFFLAIFGGALFGFVAYAGREIGQVEQDLKSGGPIDWVDHILDAAVPFLVLVLTSAFLGW